MDNKVKIVIGITFISLILVIQLLVFSGNVNSKNNSLIKKSSYAELMYAVDKQKGESITYTISDHLLVEEIFLITEDMDSEGGFFDKECVFMIRSLKEKAAYEITLYPFGKN